MTSSELCMDVLLAENIILEGVGSNDAKRSINRLLLIGSWILCSLLRLLRSVCNMRCPMPARCVVQYQQSLACCYAKLRIRLLAAAQCFVAVDNETMASGMLLPEMFDRRVGAIARFVSSFPMVLGKWRWLTLSALSLDEVCAVKIEWHQQQTEKRIALVQAPR